MGNWLIDGFPEMGKKSRMNEIGRERIFELMKRRKMNMKSLSLAAGLGDTYVRDIVKRKSDGRTPELLRLATYLNVSLDYLVGSAAQERPENGNDGDIFVVGRVGAGIWFDVSIAQNVEARPSMFPPDPRYPIDAQFDLEVSGTSLNRVAQDGDFLRCVKVETFGRSPQHGDVVIVERTTRDGGLVETTAKIYHRLNGKTVLRPASDDPQWQEPIDLSEEDSHVRITALALYKYKPVGLR